MKFLLYISVFILLSGFIKQSVYVDPTGTYILNNKTEYANSTKIGKIQVKKFSDKKIILNFYINMGSPAFNSGSFLDTLSYEKNKAGEFSSKPYPKKRLITNAGSCCNNFCSCFFCFVVDLERA